ncbi:MAG: glycosyltransferase family 39 protein [Verrucomicrobiales bacterium]
MDRDEPLFAQATKQMLESGDFVSIRFQDVARNKKPAGIYWLQAASVTAAEWLGLDDARRSIWVYRLPSLLAATGSVLLVYWVALAFVARSNAFLAAALFSCVLLLGVEARLAKTDAAVLASTLAGMGAFARIYLKQGAAGSWSLPLIFWTSIGLGVLIKGPITPLVPFLAGIMLALSDRSAPWLGALKPLPGLIWAALIVTPWFVLIMIATEGQFLRDSLGNDLLAKLGSGQEGHGSPPLTYLAFFWVTASPMAPLAVLAAPFVWRERKDRGVRFLAAWLIPFWVLFECIATKLPHYLLPVYPAVAILIAIAIEREAMNLDSRWRRTIPWIIPILTILSLVAPGAYGLWAKTPPGMAYWVFAPLAAGFSICFAAGSRDYPTRVINTAAGAVCFYLATYSGLLTAPFGRKIAISPQLAASSSIDGCPDPELASAGYSEPSLVLLTRTDIALVDGRGAAEFMNSGPCRIAFVEREEEASFKSVLDSQTGVVLRERISGFDINSWRWLDIGVWVRERAIP